MKNTLINMYANRLARFPMALSIIATAVAVLSSQSAHAEVKLPAIISNHMVVQADTTIPIWGWAAAGEQVTVSLAGQTQTAQPGADGKWNVTFNKFKATNEPQTLTVKGQNTLTVTDVLVGEVWLASGQSNMAFQVSRGQNAEQEASAGNFPQMRMFTVKRNPQRVPQTDCEGIWEVCSPDTVSQFSAVAYFFGRELHQRLKTPVGMINSSVGGTDIAAWTSEPTQSKIPELKAQLDKWAQDDAAYDAKTAAALLEKQLVIWKQKADQAKAASKKSPPKPRLQVKPSLDDNCPANLYSGMIAPIVPYALRGAIWYQGEHNTSTEAKARLYFAQLPLLVEDWRARWGTEFPFAWVQLPNFERKDFRPLVREAMLQSLRVKNTGMAVTTDVGDPLDNHPKNKQEVGRRLSLWALGTVYGQKVAAVCGPLPDGHQVRGSEIVLNFKHADGGLTAKNSEAASGDLRGFLIAGKDKEWKPAQARIDGVSVVVSNPEIKEPVAVRYSWASNPDGNLYNGGGLPASPFRTDDWDK